MKYYCATHSCSYKNTYWYHVRSQIPDCYSARFLSAGHHISSHAENTLATCQSVDRYGCRTLNIQPHRLIVPLSPTSSTCLKLVSRRWRCLLILLPMDICDFSYMPYSTISCKRHLFDESWTSSISRLQLWVYLRQNKLGTFLILEACCKTQMKNEAKICFSCVLVLF